MLKNFLILAVASFSLLSRVESTEDSLSLENRLKELNQPAVVLEYEKHLVKNQAVKSKKRRLRGPCYEYSAEILRRKAEDYQPYIRTNSVKYGVDEALIIAVITAESCFRQRARSPKSAQGLMQLIPATAKRFGVKDAYAPAQNIRGGTRYLKFLLKRFSGNIEHAAAGYNAGEGAVDRYKGIPPYKETKEYVRRVMRVYNRLKGIYSQKSTKPHKHFIKPACRDTYSSKIRKASKLVKRIKSWRRFYTVKQPMSLSDIRKRTGVEVNELLALNRGISRLKVKIGRKVLIWQCTNQ